MPAVEPFRIGYVDGVTPDTWARRWRERPHAPRLTLVAVTDSDEGVSRLHDGDLEMCVVRLPVETDGLHLVRLYDEEPVVVASREHPVTTFDRIDLAELSDETLLEGPAASTVAAAAAQAGVVVLPLSVARAHHRRDVAHVALDGVEPTTVALVWLRARDDDRAQAFVGVVRGRRPGSSRG